MRKAGRKAWSMSDHELAVRVTDRVLTDLGFDITGWLALAGVPRNEPPEPQPVKKTRKRRAKAAPVREPEQLSFAFA
jgi:hypothetical protein